MNIKSTVILNNDLEMPVMGLGLFMVAQGNGTQNAVMGTINMPDMNKLYSLMKISEPPQTRR